MGQLNVQGTLIAGPPAATDGSFPSMTANTTIATKENPKGYGRATGVLRRQENFAVFTTLLEVGPGAVVTKGHFLWFKSNGPIELRLTTDDGAGGDVLSVIPLDGAFMQEFDIATLAGKFLKLLELNTLGQEVLVEYFIAGNA